MSHYVSSGPFSHICLFLDQRGPESSLITVRGWGAGVWEHLQGAEENPCAHLAPIHLTQPSLLTDEEISLAFTLGGIPYSSNIHFNSLSTVFI